MENGRFWAVFVNLSDCRDRREISPEKVKQPTQPCRAESYISSTFADYSVSRAQTGR